MMMTSGARPCIDCGSEGGHTPRRYKRPTRVRGRCFNCYLKRWERGEFRDVPRNRYVSFNAYGSNADPAYMLWHTYDGNRQPHALLPYAYDAPGDIAAHEAAADAWCAAHPHQRLDWPDPSLACFGAANTESRAA